MEKKKYSQNLVDVLQNNQKDVEEDGVVITYKPIPDSNEEGAMDPRVYKNSKKTNLMMKFMPKKKMQEMFSNVLNLRPMFNGVKSIPVTRDDMRIETVQMDENVTLYIYFPKEINNNDVLYYIHGGGFFAGHHGVVEQACKMFTDMHNAIVVSIDYRLAPENPYPAGHDDCYNALLWIYENIERYGGNKERIAVSGDSAGGNLCLYCAIKDKEAGKNMVKVVVPYYPTVNMCGKEDKYYHPKTSKLDIAPKYEKYVLPMMSMMGSMSMGDFLGIKDVENPYLSPYYADLTGLCPTLLMVGSHDFLFFECKAFAHKLADAKVPYKAIIYKGIGHAFLDEVGKAPQAEDSLIELSKFMKQYM